MSTSGIPDGESASVTISGTNTILVFTSDGRCQRQRSRLVCTVAGPAPVEVTAWRFPNGLASLTAVVTSNDGPDGDATNNSSTLVLD